MRYGEKYEPDSGWIPYTSKKPNTGDVIKMVVDGNEMSYWLNDSYLGVAFIDTRLKAGNGRPFVWMGNKDDQVEVLPGSVSE